MDIYYKIANRIIAKAKQIGITTIMLEDLRNLREKRKKRRSLRTLNGRLSRWGFRMLQNIIEYKSRLAGLSVIYVSAERTSSLCPVCGGRLGKSPNERRLMRCRICGLEEDRDINCHQKSPEEV
jgi:putative transposase